MAISNRILFILAPIVLCAMNGWAQSSCTSNAFVISSSNGTNVPAGGGSTTISWHKDTGGSNSCPSTITTTASWFTLQTGTSASTTGSSLLTIASNPSSAVRSGVIAVQSSPTDSSYLTITQTGSTLTADITTLTFNAPGGAMPLPQNINLTASGGAVQVGATANSSGNWLSTTLNSSTTPAVVSVSANPTGLAAGTYQGSIQIFGAGLQINVAVTLNVAAAGSVLTFAPTVTTISGMSGNSASSAAAVIMKNTGSSTSNGFTLLTDQPWLTASSNVNSLSAGQSTPVTVSATAANLKPGNYTGHVTAQGGGPTATLTVTFNVGGAAITALVDPLTLSISSGTKRSFPGVEQLSGDSTNVAVSVTQGANFLMADAAAKSPGAFGVTIDATALSPGTYGGALLIQCTSISCLPVTVQVLITVNPGSGSLNFGPSSAMLSAISGSPTAQTNVVNLQNDGSSATSFTITTDQPWLTASPLTGTLAGSQKTIVGVSASPANLAPGSYIGHVTAQGTSTSGVYTVNLSVTGARVAVSPASLTLTLPSSTRQIFPAALQLMGDSASVSIAMVQGASFVTADALVQSPGAVNITVDATKLGPGTYPASLLMNCTPGCVPISVPLSIVVTQSNSTLTFNTSGVTLTGNSGSTSPQIASATLVNNGSGPGGYTAISDQSWLTVSPSSGTIAAGQTVALTLSAFAQYLSPGTYTAHVSAGGAVFTVTFNVGGVSLFASPNPANFTVAAGSSLTIGAIQVLGGSGPVSISITSGTTWLTADPAVQAPGSFNITIDATFLKPGSYSGSLLFTCQNACVSFALPINLTVTSNGALQFNPTSLTFNFYQGRPVPGAQTLTVKSTDGTPIPFNVTNPFSWLTLSAGTGTTPATLTLTPNLNASSTSATGNLTFTPTGGQPAGLVPVTLNVQPFSISASPNPLPIMAVIGQRGQGTLNISTADGAPASIQVSANASWLSIPSSVTAPGSLAVKFDATSLGSGLFPAVVTLTCASANPCQPIQVPVNLTLTDSAILLSDVQTVAFPVQSSGPTQGTQQAVHLTSSDNQTPINFTIDPTALPSWLSVTSSALTTPATLTFSIAKPPSQQSSATVKVNSAYGSVIVAVNYTPTTAPSINSAGVVSAGGVQTKLRPGSWGTIYGDKLATTAPRDWGAADFIGSAFPTILDGVAVTIGGKPAFVRSISPTQINFQCPDGIGSGAVPLTVNTSMGVSNTVLVTVDNYAPAFFIGVSTNSRNYVAATETTAAGVVYIGPASTSGVRPAKAGENVTLWSTGFGPTTPNVPAGMLFSGAAPLNDSVQILLDGVAVTPQFAGISAAGLYQFNIAIPNLPPGDHKLTAMIGGVSTGDGIWLATQ